MDINILELLRGKDNYESKHKLSYSDINKSNYEALFYYD